MKGSTKLSLAIALALTGSNAFALGLGSIQVKSGLNQPLNAEITVIADSPAEVAGLNVGLASAEDFQRVGLDRARVNVPIEFSVITTGRQPVIKLTTKDPVREPFLDFLVEVNWSKGKLLREYTVLLDSPVMAPASKGSVATVAPAHEAAPAPAEKLAPAPAKPAKPPAVKPPRAVAETKPEKPAAAPKPAPKPAPAPKPNAPEHAAAAGEYGPVAEGETLSEIARATRDENVDVNAMMLALLKNNPNAFYKDNINALKRGAILRIPSHDEIKAAGSAAAAAAAVREQNQAWASNAPVAKPTLVATAGAPKPAAPPAKTEKPARGGGEHLALVPPAANKGGQSAADRPGPASGTGAGTAGSELKAELARTKEALASREQEVSELKSRVKDLEELNNKDQRLLALKQSEIAELQAKLKELEAKGGKPEAAKPAATAATAPAAAPTATASKPAETPAAPGKPEGKLTAQDIWGKISETEKAGAAKPATPEAAKPTTPEAGKPGATAATPAPAPTATTPAPTAAATPATAPTTAPSAPSAAAPTTTPAAKPEAATTPLKPKPAPTVAPIPAPPETPWYQNTLVLGGVGAGLLLVGLLALMRFLRKPRPLPAIGEAEMEEAAAAAPMAEEENEQELLDQLAQHPGDPALSLRLLNLYYARRDAGKFEAAAEAMYAHIADPTQPEWQQVKAMGEELCPHNPLFGGHEDMMTMAGHEAPAAEAHHAPEAEEAFDLGGYAH